MRILHITPQFYPATGGAELYTKEISERLAQRGHDVTVLTTDSDGGSPTTAEVINGVTVSRFMPPGKLHDLINGLLSMRGALWLSGFSMRVAKVQMLAGGPYGLRAFHLSARSNADVVAVINWYGGSLAYQTCLARRIRDFALVGIPLFHTEFHWSHSAPYADMLGRCDAVIAMTEHEKNFIEQRSTQKNARVVGVGVDPSIFANAAGNEFRARHGIGDAPMVGYVGRMAPSKGVPTLIEAMKRVWRTEPTVRLLLAGSGLPTGSNPQDEIAQTFAGLSCAERSRIITTGGFGEGEKGSLFDALDLFAMPSVAESFGIAYLEAWVCKKAVIGSRIGSTQCVIEDGVDGVLVAPGNPEDLAGSILRLLSDRGTREQMGRMGHSKTMSRFTWDKITDKVEDIYNQARVATLNGRSAQSVEKSLRGRKARSRCA